MSYMTLSSREKHVFQKIIPSRHPFFTLFVLSHASGKHYFSKYWEGRIHGPSPTSNFFGEGVEFGGRKFFSLTNFVANRPFLGKKCPFSRRFFIVIELLSLLLLSDIISYITCISLFSWRKHLFHTKISVFLFSYFRTLPYNTTSSNIGGTDAWAVPPPPIFGGPSPQSPLGLRPWEANSDGERCLL